MSFLVDTSVLLRVANRRDAQYPVTEKALETLSLLGEILHLTPQNLIEFRNGATRPIEVNGLGLSIAAAEFEAEECEATFPLLPETPAIYPAWKALVQAAGVIGKQVHDARRVAICHVYGISHILTFNVRHFARMATLGPGLTGVDPNTI